MAMQVNGGSLKGLSPDEIRIKLTAAREAMGEEEEKKIVLKFCRADEPWGEVISYFHLNQNYSCSESFYRYALLGF